MSDPIQAFLARIGLRPLTDAEARQLHILRIRAGKVRSGGVIAKLAEEADRVRQAKADDPGTAGA